MVLEPDGDEQTNVSACPDLDTRLAICCLLESDWQYIPLPSPCPPSAYETPFRAFKPNDSLNVRLSRPV
jgi:hypothetical protein